MRRYVCGGMAVAPPGRRRAFRIRSPTAALFSRINEFTPLKAWKPSGPSYLSDSPHCRQPGTPYCLRSICPSLIARFPSPSFPRLSRTLNQGGLAPATQVSRKHEPSPFSSSLSRCQIQSAGLALTGCCQIVTPLVLTIQGVTNLTTLTASLVK